MLKCCNVVSIQVIHYIVNSKFKIISISDQQEWDDYYTHWLK